MIIHYKGYTYYDVMDYPTLIKKGLGFDASGINNPNDYNWGYTGKVKIYYPIPK